MLSQTIILEIDRLLKEGQLSQRKIARRLGVSRGTISAIARGRRRLHGKEPWREKRSAGPARCPACGYRVYLPCMICRAREYREQYRRTSSDEQRRDGGEVGAAYQVSCNGKKATDGNIKCRILLFGGKGQASV
jgi:hypothetical protein